MNSILQAFLDALQALKVDWQGVVKDPEFFPTALKLLGIVGRHIETEPPA